MSAALDRNKVAAARVLASARQPYLASALFASPVVAERECGTIAVDRAWQVHADPALVDEFDVEDLAALFVHLAAHLLRDHAARAAALGVEADDARGWWNRCTDAEINDDLVFVGFVPRVAPDLPHDLGAQAGELAETIYAGEPVAGRHWDCGPGCDSSNCWDDKPGAGLRGDAQELLRLGVAADIQRQNAREPGTVPGGWLRWAESMLPSRVDWRRVLAAEVRRCVASVAGNVDYTYRRPSRRAGAAGRVVLPSLHRPVPEVAIVCDTSGSMHEELLARALAEVEGILQRGGLRAARIPVLAVDTNVQAVRRVSRAADVALVGGGGTDMGAGIEHAARLRPRPSVVIVLTDGYTPWPDRAPKGIHVVVGLLTDPMAPPFGEFAAPRWARVVPIEP